MLKIQSTGEARVHLSYTCILTRVYLLQVNMWDRFCEKACFFKISIFFNILEV